MLRTLNDRIIVQMIDESQRTTPSGLAIPEGVLIESRKARVVTTGQGYHSRDGKTILPLSVKEGDVVILSDRSAEPIKFQGEEYLVVSERDILAVLE